MIQTNDRFQTYSDNSSLPKEICVKILWFGKVRSMRYEKLNCFFNERIQEWYFFDEGSSKDGFTLQEFISVQ